MINYFEKFHSELEEAGFIIESITEVGDGNLRSKRFELRHESYSQGDKFMKIQFDVPENIIDQVIVDHINDSIDEIKRNATYQFNKATGGMPKEKNEVIKDEEKQIIKPGCGCGSGAACERIVQPSFTADDTGGDE